MAKVTGTQLRAALDDAVSTGGDWWRVNCPVCPSRTGKEDLRRSFAMRPEGYYLCHKCGVRGWSKTVKQELGGEWTARSFLRDFSDITNEDSPERKKPPKEYIALGTHEGKTAISIGWARDYLLNRGVPEDLWGPLQIGACATGFFAGRIIIPVVTKRGEWNGFVARAAMPGLDPKYIYPKGFHRASVFFNEPILESKCDDESPVLITEGVFDAIKLFPDAVACLGKPTNNQTQKLLSAHKNAVVGVLLDADAQSEGEALALKLQLYGVRAFYIKLPPGEDPGGMDEAELRALIDNSNPFRKV